MLPRGSGRQRVQSCECACCLPILVVHSHSVMHFSEDAQMSQSDVPPASTRLDACVLSTSTPAPTNSRKNLGAAWDQGDGMSHRGWSLNALQHPPCLHLCVTMCHVGKAEVFLADLEASTLEAGASAAEVKIFLLGRLRVRICCFDTF